MGEKKNNHQQQRCHGQETFFVGHVLLSRSVFVSMLKGKPRRVQSASQHHDCADGKASYPEPTVEAKAVYRGGAARGERRPGEVDGGGGPIALTGVRDNDVAVDIDAHRGVGLRGWSGWVELRVGTRWWSSALSSRGESVRCHHYWYGHRQGAWGGVLIVA